MAKLTQKQADKLAEQARQLINAMPTTPPEIAEFLAARGHRGKRADPDCCPVQRYLAANLELPEDTVVFVGVSGWHIVNTQTTVGQSGDCEQGVRAFINLFDQNAYPRLVEEEDEEDAVEQ